MYIGEGRKRREASPHIPGQASDHRRAVLWQYSTVQSVPRVDTVQHTSYIDMINKSGMWKRMLTYIERINKSGMLKRMLVEENAIT